MQEHRFARISVNRIADDGRQRMGRMHPDLVCTSGFGREGNERPPVFDFGKRPVARCGGAAVRVDDDAPAGPGAADLAQRRVDAAFADRRHGGKHRQIGLANHAVGEQPAKPPCRRRVARQHEAARRVAIKAVHGLRQAPKAEGKFLQPGFEAERRTRTRVNGKPRRLVNDKDMRINIEHGNRGHGFIPQPDRRGRQPFNADIPQEVHRLSAVFLDSAGARA